MQKMSQMVSSFFQGDSKDSGDESEEDDNFLMSTSSDDSED